MMKTIEVVEERKVEREFNLYELVNELVEANWREVNKIEEVEEVETETEEVEEVNLYRLVNELVEANWKEVNKVKEVKEVKEIEVKVEEVKEIKVKEETEYTIYLNDKKQYSKDGAKKFAGYIKNNMVRTTVTLNDLIKISEEGKTVRPNDCEATEDTWKSQQLFYMDIDENMSIKEFMKSKYMKLNPTFIYTSLSNTKEHNKFRIIFINKEEITDYKVAKDIQNRLLQFFKESDQKCKDLSRFYYGGRKSIIINKDNRLNLEVLFENTHKEEVREIKAAIKQENRELIDTNFADYLIAKNFTKCKEVIEDVEMSFNKTFESEYDFSNFCKTEIDLEELFGLSSSFMCILPEHEDNHPSANFFKEGEYGINLYKCFSCDRTLNIFELFEALTGMDIVSTQELICELFNIELKESEEFLRTAKMIRKNRQALQDNSIWKEFKLRYKYLSKGLSYGRRDKYLRLLSYCESNMEGGNTYNDYCVFYASIDKLAECLGVSDKKIVNKTIQTLAVMGLIEKVNIKDVSARIAKQLNNNKYDKYTSCYLIKPFGYTQLANMEAKAENLYNNNFSVAVVSRQHLADVVGTEETQEMYHQTKVEISSYDKNQIKKVVKAIKSSMKRKKYITQKDAIIAVQKEFQIGMGACEKLVKRYINNILESMNCELVLANKEAKVRYNIPNKINGNVKVMAKN